MKIKHNGREITLVVGGDLDDLQINGEYVDTGEEIEDEVVDHILNYHYDEVYMERLEYFIGRAEYNKE